MINRRLIVSLVQTATRYFYHLMQVPLAPVILLHELAHIVACLLLRVRVEELCLIPPGRPHDTYTWAVKHEGSERRLVQSAISLAPLVFIIPAGIWIPSEQLHIHILGWISLAVAAASAGDVAKVLISYNIIESSDFLSSIEDQFENRIVLIDFDRLYTHKSIPWGRLDR